MTVVLLVLVVVMVLAWAAGTAVARRRREHRSIDHYGRAMRHLAQMAVPRAGAADDVASADAWSSAEARAAFDPAAEPVDQRPPPVSGVAAPDVDPLAGLRRLGVEIDAHRRDQSGS